MKKKENFKIQGKLLYIITFISYTILIYILLYEEKKKEWYLSSLIPALVPVFGIFIYWRWISKSMYCATWH